MENVKRIVKEYWIYVAIIVVILLIKSYVIAPIVVNGTSMDSTLRDGDLMLLNKFEYEVSDIHRFDIVVVKHDGKHIIKRVIGMPGDSVKCEDNILYINGKVYAEEYLDPGTETQDFEIAEIAEGYYFVLGDNREVSLDSRSIGPVKESDIEGHAFFTLFPFNRFGKSE